MSNGSACHCEERGDVAIRILYSTLKNPSATADGFLFLRKLSYRVFWALIFTPGPMMVAVTQLRIY